MICRTERASATMRRQRLRQRGADDDALAVGLRLHDRDRLLRQVVEVDALEAQLQLAGLDLGQIEQIVEQRDQMRAGSVDVLEIVAIALVADRAEALAPSSPRKTR